MRACTDPRGAPWGSVGPPWGPTGVLRIKLCISPSDLPRLTQAGWRPLDVEKSVYTTLQPPDPDFSHKTIVHRMLNMEECPKLFEAPQAVGTEEVTDASVSVNKPSAGVGEHEIEIGHRPQAVAI